MKKNIVKTFSTVFIITVISKVLGLIRDIIFANFYGDSVEATAYFTAIKIPTLVVDIILSSAIVSCFIPVFNEVLSKEGKEKANKFASKFISLVGTIATTISLIGIVLSPLIVKLIAGGLPENALMLTQDLTAITFPMIIFTALAFSLVGFLQSYGEYNIPASISGISNILVIIFLLVFHNKSDIAPLCYFMVFAWFVQFAVQLPFARKFGYDFKCSFDFKDENIKKVFKLSIPIILSTAVLPINSLVSTRFASNLGENSIAILDYAYKLYIVISGIFTYAIGNIIFPELSKASTNNDSKEYTGIIIKAIKLLSFILIPLTLGIFIYSKDIVSIFYERGEFTAQTTLNVSSALFYYAIGIIGAGIVEIMNKSFYSKQNTKTPLLVGCAIIILNLIMCFILSKTSLGYNGLALATSITALINGIVLLSINHVKYGTIINKDVVEYFLKIAFSSICMVVFVYGINVILVANNLQGTLILNLIRVAIGALSGVACYFILTHFLRVNEFKTLFQKN